MNGGYLIWGFALGLLAVILGAFGAHALKDLITENQLESFQTGLRYQMYHALLFILLSKYPEYQSKTIGTLLKVGITLFSFSIYLLACRDLLDVNNMGFLGPITPIGGTLLIAAWTLMLVKAIKSKPITN